MDEADNKLGLQDRCSAIGPRCAHVHDGQVRAYTAHRPDIRPQSIIVAALTLFSCCVDGRRSSDTLVRQTRHRQT